MAKIVKISDRTLSEAATCIKCGELVAFPTETVYGLGAHAGNEEAVARLFAAKNRPQFNPLISHFPHADAAFAQGQVTKTALLLAKAFWPGPLTIILTRTDACKISWLASAGGDSVALRVPDHEQAIKLLNLCHVPVVAPSANLSGRMSPTSAAHVKEGLGDKCHMILDGGACRAGLESTVIDCREDRAVLLRPGPITAEQIRQQADVTLVLADGHGGKPVAPGYMASHYAPHTPVRMNATNKRQNEIFIGFGPMPASLKADFNLSTKGDLLEAAANLFALMHLADKCDKQSIAFAPVTMTGLGVAINDRLKRASAPRPPQER